jgi:N-acetylglucosaminyl-diphospho-decaprenol L-rhamnosyltransferase
MNPLTLSVIVVNWKVHDLLRDCLSSLYAQTSLPAGEWEVIVVDNASCDGSVEMVRREFSGCTLVANPENVGFAKANNQAFALARGEFILLLNPDTVVLDNAAGRMLAVMASRPDVAALGCRLLNADRSFQRWTGGSQPTLANCTAHFLLLHKVLPNWMLPRSLYLEDQPLAGREVGWVSGACMMLRRGALEGRLFDERLFMYCEDVELCARLIRAGWKVFFAPGPAIVHLDGRSLALQTPEIRVSQMRSLRQVFKERHSRGALFLYDMVILAGFSMRYVISIQPFAGSGRDARKAEERGRRFVGEAFRSLVQRWYTD